MAGDDDTELLDAPTVEAAVRVLGARAIEERFGIPADAAKVLAEAVVPAGDVGVEYARVGSTGLLIRPVRVRAIGTAPDPISDTDIAAQVPLEETLGGVLDLAALWVDAAPGRVLRIEVHADAVRADLEDADGAIRRVDLPRPHPEMPSAVVHDSVSAVLCALETEDG